MGTPLICHVLSDFGYDDEAFMLLNRDEYPSWLYPITRGATTIWERWDGIKVDSSFQDKGMNSFNHYAYGAIGDWMYRYIAGINPDPEQPGFKHSFITPHTGGGLTQAAASLQTVHGILKSEWHSKNEKMEVSVRIPANTTATILLPDADMHAVMEAKQPIAKANGVKSFIQMNGKVKIEVGSGEYVFRYPVK